MTDFLYNRPRLPSDGEGRAVTQQSLDGLAPHMVMPTFRARQRLSMGTGDDGVVHPHAQEEMDRARDVIAYRQKQRKSNPLVVASGGAAAARILGHSSSYRRTMQAAVIAAEEEEREMVYTAEGAAADSTGATGSGVGPRVSAAQTGSSSRYARAAASMGEGGGGGGRLPSSVRMPVLPSSAEDDGTVNLAQRRAEAGERGEFVSSAASFTETDARDAVCEKRLRRRSGRSGGRYARSAVQRMRGQMTEDDEERQRRIAEMRKQFTAVKRHMREELGKTTNIVPNPRAVSRHAAAAADEAEAKVGAKARGEARRGGGSASSSDPFAAARRSGKKHQ